MKKKQIVYNYFISEKLDKVIDYNNVNKETLGVCDAVNGKRTDAIPPEIENLVRLHQIIRKRKIATVLEFGVGYSTLVIADALRKNHDEWKALKNAPQLRNRFLFKVFSVDASKHWIENVRLRIPSYLRKYVSLSHSQVVAGTYCGQICHYYKNIPDIVPDFIYLDGPNPKDVHGHINGMSFHCDERTVMSGDILLMEPTLLPEVYILVDGRTNNARFLKTNLKRNYIYKWDKSGDVTHFILNEKRLGKYNIYPRDVLNANTSTRKSRTA